MGCRAVPAGLLSDARIRLRRCSVLSSFPGASLRTESRMCSDLGLSRSPSAVTKQSQTPADLRIRPSPCPAAPVRPVAEQKGPSPYAQSSLAPAVSPFALHGPDSAPYAACPHLVDLHCAHCCSLGGFCDAGRCHNQLGRAAPVVGELQSRPALLLSTQAPLPALRLEAGPVRCMPAAQ